MNTSLACSRRLHAICDGRDDMDAPCQCECHEIPKPTRTDVVIAEARVDLACRLGLEFHAGQRLREAAAIADRLT